MSGVTSLNSKTGAVGLTSGNPLIGVGTSGNNVVVTAINTALTQIGVDAQTTPSPITTGPVNIVEGGGMTIVSDNIPATITFTAGLQSWGYMPQSECAFAIVGGQNAGLIPLSAFTGRSVWKTFGSSKYLTFEWSRISSSSAFTVPAIGLYGRDIGGDSSGINIYTGPTLPDPTAWEIKWFQWNSGP